MRSYEDFWLVTRAALEFSLASIGSAPAAALCDRLMGICISICMRRL